MAVEAKKIHKLPCWRTTPRTSRWVGIAPSNKEAFATVFQHI